MMCDFDLDLSRSRKQAKHLFTNVQGLPSCRRHARRQGVERSSPINNGQNFARGLQVFGSTIARKWQDIIQNLLITKIFG